MLLSGAGLPTSAEETPPTQVNLQTSFTPGQYSSTASNPYLQRMQAIQAGIQTCLDQEQLIVNQEQAKEQALFEKAKLQGLLAGTKKTKSNEDEEDDVDLEDVKDAVLQTASAIKNSEASQYDLGSLCQKPSLDPKNLACSSFKSGSRFDPESVKRQKADLDIRAEACQLKQTKLERVRKSLECFSVQSSAIAETIGITSQDIAGSLQRAQEEVSQIQAAEMDRAGQLADVNDRLTGTGNGLDPTGSVSARGEKGLLILLQESLAVERDLPSKIAEIESSNAKIANDKVRIENLVVNRKASQMAECFKNDTSPKFRCDSKSKSVGAREFLVCRYKQNAHLGKNGKIEKDDRIGEVAAGKAAALESTLDAILADIPSTAAPAEGKAAGFASGGKIKTPEDIQKKYGSRLRALSASGINVDAVVLDMMKTCYSRADSAVEEERTMPDSQIGTVQFGLQELERQTKQNTDVQIDESASKLSNIAEALTGVPTPFNTERCRKVKPSDQVNCLKDIRATLTGMLKGTTPESKISMTLPAKQDTTGARNIAFNCYGLQGCVRTLQNISKNLGTEIGRIRKYRGDRVRTINGTVTTQVQSMQQAFRPALSKLNEALQKMNLDLSKLGAEKGIELDRVECKPLEPNKDMDGLFNAPTDVVSLIGGCNTPQMYNTAANDFSSAASGLSDAGGKMQETLGTVNELLGAIDGKFEQCRADDLKDQKKAIKEVLGSFGTENCGYIAQYCKDGETPFDHFKEVLQELKTGSDSEDNLEVSTFDQLQSGVIGLCDPYKNEVNAVDKKPDKDGVIKTGDVLLKSCKTQVGEMSVRTSSTEEDDKTPVKVKESCITNASQLNTDSKPDDLGQFLTECCMGTTGTPQPKVWNNDKVTIVMYVDHLKLKATASKNDETIKTAKKACEEINNSLYEKLDNFGKSGSDSEKNSGE